MLSAVAFEAAAAASAAAAGALLLAHRTARLSAWLLLATAVTVPAAWVGPSSASVPFTLSLLTGGLAPVLAACSGLLWPTAASVRDGGRRAALVVSAAAIAGSVGVQSGRALVFDPAGAGCNDCSANLLQVGADDALAASLATSGVVVSMVCSGVVALVAAWRWQRASRWGRRQSAVALAGGGAIAAVECAGAAHRFTLPADAYDAVSSLLFLVQCALVIVLAVGGMTRVHRLRTAGPRMARTVLAAIPTHEGVLRSLRAAVGDPRLSICYLREDSRPVGPDGEPTPEPMQGSQVAAGSRERVLRLSRDRRPVAQIRYDGTQAGTSRSVAVAARSAGLTLEYLAAQARLRAELSQAAQVRARLVAAGSTERRRLERNLHDGAQQRLIALGMMLTASCAATGISWHDEHAELDAALAELRSVARGLFPTSLAEVGVCAALRELGDHTACPLVVTGALDDVALDVAMATYQLVDDLARANPASCPLSVDLDGGGAMPVAVTVRTGLGNPKAVRGSILHAEDRFVAAGGRLTLAASPTGVVVHGSVPCGS